MLQDNSVAGWRVKKLKVLKWVNIALHDWHRLRLLIWFENETSPSRRCHFSFFYWFDLFWRVMTNLLNMRHLVNWLEEIRVSWLPSSLHPEPKVCHCLVDFHRATVVEEALGTSFFVNRPCTGTTVVGAVVSARLVVKAGGPDLRLCVLVEIQRQIYALFLEVALIQIWDKWRINALIENVVPVNAIKPRVPHNFLDRLRTVIPVLLQELGNQVSHLYREFGQAQVWVLTHDFVEHPGVIFVVEGREAGQHFVQKNSKAENVESVVVAT